MTRLQSPAPRVLALALAACLTGCTSTTRILTTPVGATLYVEDRRVCTTPCVYKDKRTSFSQVRLRLEKRGYEPLHTVIARDSRLDVFALIFGMVFWAVGYEEQYSYVLKPAADVDALDWEKDVESPDEDSDDLY